LAASFVQHHTKENYSNQTQSKLAASTKVYLKKKKKLGDIASKKG